MPRGPEADVIKQPSLETTPEERWKALRPAGGGHGEERGGRSPADGRNLSRASEMGEDEELDALLDELNDVVAA